MIIVEIWLNLNLWNLSYDLNVNIQRVHFNGTRRKSKLLYDYCVPITKKTSNFSNYSHFHRIPIKFKFVPNSFDDQDIEIGIERKRKSATNLRCNLIRQSAYVDAINSSRLATNVTIFIQLSLFRALRVALFVHKILSPFNYAATCATFIFPFSFSDLCCCDSRVFCLRCLQFEKVLRFRTRFGILGE